MLILPHFDLCISLNAQQEEVLVLVLEREDLPLLGELNKAEISTNALHEVMLVLEFSQGQLGCMLTEDVATSIRSFNDIWVCVVDEETGVVFEAQSALHFSDII